MMRIRTVLNDLVPEALGERREEERRVDVAVVVGGEDDRSAHSVEAVGAAA